MVCGSRIDPLGVEIVVDGGVVSISMPPRLAVVMFPATSEAVALTDWSAPSPRVVLVGQVAIPESESRHAQLTVTGAFHQPNSERWPEDVREPDRVGAVVSMLIPLTVVDPELPAASHAVPLTDWPAPSVDNVTSLGQLATPERLSEQVK